MLRENSPHRVRNARSGPHRVKWVDVAAPRPRQFDPAPYDPLYKDPNFSGGKVGDTPNPGVELLPGQDPDPSSPGPRPDFPVPSPSSPFNSAGDPSAPQPIPASVPLPSSSQLPEDDPTEFDAGASLLPSNVQPVKEYIPLGLDVDPGRPPIVAILSCMSFIVVLLFVLLFILPITQSKRRRYHHVAYVSEEERKSMAVNGYPPTPHFYGARPPILSLHLDQEEFDVPPPSVRRIPPGLQLGAAIGLPGGRSIPLAPPSPRSGGLPSNPRSGLPVRSPIPRSNVTTPTSSDTLDPGMAHAAPFRGRMLRPTSGVVTWSVVDPLDDYSRAWAGYEGRPSHIRPPRSSVAQAVRNSIVSTLSFSGLRGSLHKARHSHIDSGGGYYGSGVGGSGLRWESMIPEEGLSPDPYAGDIRKAWS